MAELRDRDEDGFPGFPDGDDLSFTGGGRGGGGGFPTTAFGDDNGEAPTPAPTTALGNGASVQFPRECVHLFPVPAEVDGFDTVSWIPNIWRLQAPCTEGASRDEAGKCWDYQLGSKRCAVEGGADIDVDDDEEIFTVACRTAVLQDWDIDDEGSKLEDGWVERTANSVAIYCPRASRIGSPWLGDFTCGTPSPSNPTEWKLIPCLATMVEDATVTVFQSDWDRNAAATQVVLARETDTLSAPNRVDQTFDFLEVPLDGSLQRSKVGSLGLYGLIAPALVAFLAGCFAIVFGLAWFKRHRR